MATDPRLALEELIEAFRAHFALANSDIDPDADEFIDAEERLSNAFFTYDDVLFTQMEIELPFEILDEEDFDDEFEDNDTDEDFIDDEELDDEELDDDITDEELDDEFIDIDD